MVADKLISSTLTLVALLWSTCSLADTGQETPPSSELAPRLITLHHAAIPLKKALQELAAQGGALVEDRRHERTDVTLNLDLDKVTFWQALDTIAREANLHISLYESDGRLALRDGPWHPLPVSYHGLFRTSVRRVTVDRDLETQKHEAMIHLEIAWEPRFQPLFLQSQLDFVTVKEDKGRLLNVADPGSGMIPLAGRTTIATVVHVQAPPRTVNALGIFTGRYSIIGPSKILTFTFDDLVKIDKAEPPRKETQEGVTVQITELRTQPGRWRVSLLLTYPPGGPEFESFQSWLVNNEIRLEKKGSEPVAPGAYTTDNPSSRQTRFTYYFTEEKGVTLGNLEDWKLTYRTPGRIVTLPIPFEFKNVPLP